jgi:hypothetical protein
MNEKEKWIARIAMKWEKKEEGGENSPWAQAFVYATQRVILEILMNNQCLWNGKLNTCDIKASLS